MNVWKFCEFFSKILSCYVLTYLFNSLIHHFLNLHLNIIMIIFVVDFFNFFADLWNEAFEISDSSKRMGINPEYQSQNKNKYNSNLNFQMIN